MTDIATIPQDVELQAEPQAELRSPLPVECPVSHRVIGISGVFLGLHSALDLIAPTMARGIKACDDLFSGALQRFMGNMQTLGILESSSLSSAFCFSSGSATRLSKPIIDRSLPCWETSWDL